MPTAGAGSQSPGCPISICRQWELLLPFGECPPREMQQARGCGHGALPGGALRRAGGKPRKLKLLPSPATQGLVFEVAAVSVPPAAGLLPRLRSVLAGPLASGCVYLSKPSFYLGCVSRAAGAEGGVEGCCQGAPQPQPPTQSPAIPAPLGHPVSGGSPVLSCI